MTRRVRLFLTGLLLMAPHGAFAEGSNIVLAPGVDMTVEPSVVRIGDSIQVSVTGPGGTSLALPAPLDTLGPFDVLGSEIGTIDGRPRLTLHLAAFDVGSLEIPAFDVPVTAGATPIRTRPYRITVESLLPADSAAVDSMTIRAAHPPLELSREFRWRTALGYFLVLVALGLLGWWLYQRWRNRPVVRPAVVAAPIVVRPAELVALESLDALMARGYALRGLFKEHYTEALDILRLFVEKRLGIEALDQTSFELLASLSRNGLSIRGLAGMSALLEEADLVKFAKQMPTVESAVALVETARAWVRETHAEATAREAMSPPLVGTPARPTVTPTVTPTKTTPETATPTPPAADEPRSNEGAS